MKKLLALLATAIAVISLTLVSAGSAQATTPAVFELQNVHTGLCLHDDNGFVGEDIACPANPGAGTHDFDFYFQAAPAGSGDSGRLMRNYHTGNCLRDIDLSDSPLEMATCPTAAVKDNSFTWHDPLPIALADRTGYEVVNEHSGLCEGERGTFSSPHAVSMGGCPNTTANHAAQWYQNVEIP